MGGASLGCAQRGLFLSEAKGPWTSLGFRRANSLSRSRTSTSCSSVTPSESLLPAQSSAHILEDQKGLLYGSRARVRMSF